MPSEKNRVSGFTLQKILSFVLCYFFSGFFWIQSAFAVAQSNSIKPQPEPWSQSQSKLTELPIAIELGEEIQISKKVDITFEKNSFLKISASDTKFIIRGESRGTTKYKLKEGFFHITVFNNTEMKLFKCLQTQIIESLGLFLEIKSNEINVSGELGRFSEWKDLRDRCSQFGKYRFNPKISDELKSVFSNQLKRLARTEKIDLPRFILTPRPQVFISESKKISERERIWLESYGLFATTQTDIVESPLLVRTRIVIAEIKNEVANKFGVEWPSSIQGKLTNGSGVEQKALFTELHFLESSGFGQTLASPNLLAKSGAESEFWSGGEFPIKISSKQKNDVQWKKYGILLKVKPNADSFGNIDLNVTSEVSSLDFASSVDGIPSLSVNKVTSHFSVSSGNVVVLSGLLRQDQGRTAKGLPGLSSLPILGSLFSSSNFLNSKSQLVIFVKPEITKTEAHDD